MKKREMNTDDLNFERGTMLIGSFLDRNGHRNSDKRNYQNPTDIGSGQAYESHGTGPAYTNYFQGTDNLYD